MRGSGIDPRKQQGEHEVSSEHWMTYSDLMASLLMIFALILSVTMLMSTQEHQEQQAQNRQQEHRLNEQQEELNKKRQELVLAERRVGIRQRIIEELKERLAGYDVRVDSQTGALLIAAAVLFDQDDATVRDDGKRVLVDVMDAYASVFFDTEEYTSSLSRITVEGHTNDDGTYLYNLDLSQRRAFNVMQFIIESFKGAKYEDLLKKYMAASGRSEMDLIKASDDAVDKERSRRIEIKFSLRDEDVIDTLRRIFEGSS